MTVSYQSDVASSTSGGLIKLLWRWRGSVWKLVYKELFLFQIAFISLQLLYYYILEGIYKDAFKWIVVFCSGFVDMIPLSFILGFYVSFIATRWWNQYTAIPWPDKLMNTIALYIPGNDETNRMLRRTLMRYANLSLVLVLRSISIAVKRRFPTREHLVEAGFMNKNELDMFSAVPSNEFNTFWIPCTWFVSLLREARQDCRLTDSCGLKIIMEELNEFRNKCGLLWSYDWVSIPLVYTQVVTLATYCFFVASLFGRQYIDSPYPSVFNENFLHKGERFIPIFSTIQFVLYMGLLKLGEQLINPFGDDDEDFELNWIIDRHIKISFLGVDVLNARPPPLTKDDYFDDTDIKLPYTAAAVSYKKKTYRGSMAAYHVPSEQQGLVLPEFDEDYNEDNFFSNTLHSAGSKNQSSLWSIFNKTQKHQSSSFSLDSENLTNYKDWQESIEKSSESYLDDQTYIENQNLNHLTLNEDNNLLITNKNKFETLEHTKIDKEILELNENILDNQKTKDNLSKESSQDSQHLITQKNVSSEVRKYFDIYSTNSILKTRPTNNLVNSQSKAFLLDMHLVTGAGKILSSVAKEYHNNPHRKTSAERKQGLYNFNKLEDSNNKFIDTQGNRLSISSLKSKHVETSGKNKPFQFKKVDPKLKIKPFKSKVTFLDQININLHKNKKENLIKCIPNFNKNLNIEKYDLSASSPELNKVIPKYSYIKPNISQTESDNQLENIKNKIGSLSEIPTPSDLLKQKSFFKIANSTIKPSDLEKNKLNNSMYRSTSLLKIESNKEIEFKTEFKQEPLTSTQTDYGINYNEAFIKSKEYWLRHQSLPNIQELVEESNSENLSIPNSKEITLINPLNNLTQKNENNIKKIQFKTISKNKKSELEIKKIINAEERRRLYYKTSKSSSNSITSKKKIKKKTIKIYNSNINCKRSSTESDTSTYYTANSVHIPMPEVYYINCESISSSLNLSYYSANEILNLDSAKEDI